MSDPVLPDPSLPPVARVSPEQRVVVTSPVATPAQEQAAVMKAKGQTEINRVWEYTQATIALSVVMTMLAVDALVTIYPPLKLDQSALMQLNTMASLVIGFYFGRTNHQRTGGVGGDAVTGGR